MKLEVKDITKSFGDKQVLHGISFEVQSGRALGLLGRNGAGKTTTIRILMDVFRANSGEVLLDGEKFNQRKHLIGYLPEERGLYPKKKVIEQMVYLGRIRGISKSEAVANSKKWLKRLGVLEYENAKLETLSKGNQQKVQLASTLVCDPDIVILDEPFSGLDPVNSRILQDVVMELIGQNKIVIFSSHQMSYVEEFCKDMQRLGNISLALSVEGFEEVNDSRRGSGCFEKVMHAMDLLKEHGLIFGTSICYTSKNYKTVTSDEFLDMLIDKGVRYAWYFHYMPVGNEAATDLLLTPEQREYMYHRIREIRGFEGGKPIFVFDFQNDGEFVGGCIAGGRFYCHINPNGDVEPCVFIHYSNANIHDKPLLECLSQPLFRAYQMGQPFNENDLRPCPMLENPEALQKIVHATDAKSTDMQSPETVESLCGKCEAYAKCWAPEAEKLKEANPKQITREKGTLPEV